MNGALIERSRPFFFCVRTEQECLGSVTLLRMLSDANYDNVFLNEVTGPQVRAVLGLE